MKSLESNYKISKVESVFLEFFFQSKFCWDARVFVLIIEKIINEVGKTDSGLGENGVSLDAPKSFVGTRAILPKNGLQSQ